MCLGGLCLHLLSRLVMMLVDFWCAVIVCYGFVGFGGLLWLLFVWLASCWLEVGFGCLRLWHFSGFAFVGVIVNSFCFCVVVLMLV